MSHKKIMTMREGHARQRVPPVSLVLSLPCLDGHRWSSAVLSLGIFAVPKIGQSSPSKLA